MKRGIVTNRNGAEPCVLPSDEGRCGARDQRPHMGFVHASPVGILHVDLHGTILFVNERFCELTSTVHGGELIGAELSEVQGFDPPLLGLIDQMYRSEEAVSAKRIAFHGPDGPRDLSVHGALVAPPGEGLIGGSLTFFPSTPDHELEEELRVRRMFDAVEPLLRNSALSLPSEHAFLDEVAHLLGDSARADQVYILLSAEDADAYEEEVRWAREPERSLVPLRMEVIGTRIQSGLAEGVVHLSAHTGLESAGDNAERELLLAIGAAEALAVPFVTSNEGRGVILLTRSAASPEWSAAERRVLERLGALLETLLSWMRAEQRYRTVISTIEDCLVSFSFEAGGGRSFSFITRQVERLTGCSSDDLLAGKIRWVDDIVHEADRPAVRAFHRRVRSGEDARLVYRVVHRDGQARWMRESLSPRQDSTGRLIVGGILSDVTDHKDAEAALVQAKQDAEAADRLKSAFLATMSHEMRTPLGVIKGFSDLLQDEFETRDDFPPEVREFIAAIQTNATRVLRLVGKLLDLSRLQTGRLPMETAPIALIPLLNDIVARFEQVLRQREVTVELDVGESEVICLADYGRLEEVLESIMSNAAKFTEDGSIRVDLQLNSGTAVVRVLDTGIGISDECLPQIFEPFFQEDNRLNRAFEGSGLGLSLTKRLVEAMNGSICVQSRKGEGTMIELTLPRADT
jgi:PAS domain S-box-containing protein